MRTSLLALSLALAVLAVFPARGQNAATPTTASPATAPAAGNAAAPLPCKGNAPAMLRPGAIALPSALPAEPGYQATIWEPRGGEVRFTVTAPEPRWLVQATIHACFRWHGAAANAEWVESAGAPRVIAVEDQGRRLILGARVPEGLPPTLPAWPYRPFGAAGEQEFAGLWIVPIADMRVIVSADGGAVLSDTAMPIGVTSVWFAVVATMLGVALAWAVLLSFGRSAHVPGRNAVLTLISTRRGYASLSQLQVLLWCFLIAGSCMYVMILTGELVAPGANTLALLGVVGGATIASKLQSSNEDRGAGEAPPGAPTSLRAEPGNDPDCARLRWTMPPDADAARVEWRHDEDDDRRWQEAGTARTGEYTVASLPGGRLRFRVTPRNGRGEGQPAISAPVEIAGDAPPDDPALAPPCPRGPGRTEATLVLAWAAVDGAEAYEVRYRERDSIEEWQHRHAVPTTELRVPEARPNSEYEVHVAAARAAGRGPWSAPARLRTGARRPRWSDLVVIAGQGNTIDMPRLQVLVFTLVTAVFVGLKVVAAREIPDVPESFLALMGISNSVYIGAKFVRD